MQVGATVDEAEPKLVQDTLQDSDHCCRDLIETAEYGIWILSSDDEITFANARVAEMLGYSSEEILGRTPHFFFVNNSKLHELLTRNRSGIREQNEFRVRHKHGSEFWAQLSSSPILGKDGRYTGALGILDDITARKRAERALQESERRYHEFVAHAPVGVYRTTCDGFLSMANPALVSMLGYSSFEELAGRNLDHEEAASVDQRSEFKTQLERDGKVDAVESAWKKRDESLLFVRESARVVRDENGKVLYYEGMVEDITQRRHAEEKLRRSETRLRSLIDNAPFGIYRCDPRSDRFSAANPALVRMLGYSSEDELLALEISKDVYVEAGECGRLFEQYQREGRFESEASWKRKDGKEIKVRLRGRTSRGTDSGVWLEGYVEDLSERWALEEQLRHAQKMEAIGCLAGGIAHDFNNLLMVMSGYTELLQDSIQQNQPQHKLAVGILKAVDRAKSLTKQLLVSTRQQVLTPTVIDLNSVLKELGEMLGRLIGEHIEFVVNLSPALGRVKIDAGAIQQVLMNLAVNARDAMPNGGRLLIETANVDVGENSGHGHLMIKPGRYVMLTVSDTGVGMNPETQSRIFDPFFTTKEQGKGTGLGLSIVYGVVKDSGGTIVVDSTPGRGTAFRVYLPPAEEAIQMETHQGPEQVRRGSQCILLVEDEDAARETIRMSLEAHGYTVLEAKTPAQALDIFERHNNVVDLLLTDIVMPGMTGSDLANQALQINSKLKVLYMSGYVNESIAADLAKNAAFLQKPFSFKVLAQRIWELLDVSSQKND